MFIDKLLTAIAAKFIGGGAVAGLTTAFNGRFYLEQAEGSAAMPYVVLEVVPSAPLTDAYANAISADVTVVFKVVGQTNATTAANVAAVCTALDNTALTLSGGTNIGMYRIGEPIPIKLPESENGVDTWQWSVAYVYQVQ